MAASKQEGWEWDVLTEHSQLQGLQTARTEGTAAQEALLCEQFLLMPLVGESNGVFILAGVSDHSSPATGDRVPASWRSPCEDQNKS